MNKEDMREEIILTVKKAIGNNLDYGESNIDFDERIALVNSNDIDHIAEDSADELIEQGYGDTKQTVREFADFLKDYARQVKENGYDGIGETDIDEKLKEFLNEQRAD